MLIERLFILEHCLEVVISSHFHLEKLKSKLEDWVSYFYCICLVGLKMGASRTNKVQRPLWRQRNMFGAITSVNSKSITTSSIDIKMSMLQQTLASSSNTLIISFTATYKVRRDYRSRCLVRFFVRKFP